MPATPISSVRGIGVADIASTSTSVRSRLRYSLCSTPNRCSSSMITRPSCLNLVSGDSSRWVPITTSTVAVGEPALGLRHLGRGLEPRHRLHRHRERRVPLGERVEVLLREHRRRHEHGDLLAVLHRLERGPHRDLGLAVADVAADQPVHRHRLLHVALDLVDGGELVGRLHVGERVLELALPRRVGPERVPGRGHPRRVQPDQLGGDLADRLARPALGLGPVRAAEPVQRRRLAADVLGDLVQLVGRHVQPVGRVPALGRARTRPPGSRGSRPPRSATSSRRTGRRRAARAPRSRPA